MSRQAKVKLRPRDGEHLREQRRANFNLRTNAERVNALVSGGVARARPDGLPMVIFCAVVQVYAGLAFGGESQNREAAIVAHVSKLEGLRRANRVAQEVQLAVLVGEPDKSASGPARGRRKLRQEQVNRPVIVDIARAQTNLSR